MKKKLIWLVSGLLFLADRLTKLWAENALQEQGTRAALPGVFQFTYNRNTGAAFSMLTGNNLLLASLNAAMIALVLLVYFKGKPLGALARAGLVLVVAGGLGNLIDRLVYGYVIDFIEPTFMTFAVFNIADAMVSVGALMAAAGMIVPNKGEDGA